MNIHNFNMLQITHLEITPAIYMYLVKIQLEFNPHPEVGNVNLFIIQIEHLHIYLV